VEHLTGISSAPNTSLSQGSKAPFCFQSQRHDLSIGEFALAERNILNQKLLEYGFILLRGFNIGSYKDFENFARQISGRDLFNYAGGASPRTAVTSGGLYTSTEYPPEMRIPLHNELSYSTIFPHHLFFWCVKPADSGGETTLADSRKILKAIDPTIVEKFRNRGVCYVRNLHSGRGTGYSWQDAFETDSAEKVESQCQNMDAQYEWLADNYLRVTQICTGTIMHPVTGEEVWFNQADGFHSLFADDRPRLESRFGDGSKIDISELRDIRKAIDGETIAHKWQKDDIIIVDNILAAHGRMPFLGDRKIVLAMT